MKGNISDNEEIVSQFAKEAETNFNRFSADRVEIDSVNKVADYMYKGAQNRSIMSEEKDGGMGMENDTRANTGSILYFRQVNTLASQLVQVCRSRPDLFRYRCMSTEHRELSSEDGQRLADQANALARWTMKQDLFKERIPEFAVHAYKYSNVFALINQKRNYAEITKTEPIYETVVGEDGVARTRVVREKQSKENKMVSNYPSVTFPHVDMIYADAYIPTIEQQNCVVILALRNKSEIWDDMQQGILDKEKFVEIDDDLQWDGNFGAVLKKMEAENSERKFNAGQSGMYLQWDVLMRCPIKGGAWDDESNPPVLYWGTFIGNSISGGVCVRLIRNPDPDDEIPLKEIKVNPDSSGMLYNTTNAEVVRSAYSSDCTLLNQALDNMANINDPPLLIVDGEHRVKDFTFKRARWHVNNLNAIKQFEVRDTTLQTVNMRNQIQGEIKQALATDPATIGEYAGARTSATEFLGVNQNTKNPHIAQIGYLLGQLLPWMARKYMSYWNAYGKPEQVVQIVDGDKEYSIHPKDIASKMIGGFDVIVDIVDEYEDDMLKSQQAMQLIQLIGQSPALQQSATHTVDVGEIMREWLIRMKWPVDRIILPPSGVDAEAAASTENNAMLAGQAARPKQGENHAVHLRIHKAEALRWKGLEESGDPRAANVSLIEQHIAETQQMMQPNQAPGPAPSGNQTPGEAVGNQAAAQIGAMYQ